MPHNNMFDFTTDSQDVSIIRDYYSKAEILSFGRVIISFAFLIGEYIQETEIIISTSLYTSFLFVNLCRFCYLRDLVKRIDRCTLQTLQKDLKEGKVWGNFEIS